MKTLILLVLLWPNFVWAAKANQKEKSKDFQSVRVEISGGATRADILNKSTNKTQRVDSVKTIQLDLRVLHHWANRSRSFFGLEFNDQAYKFTNGPASNFVFASPKIGHTINPLRRLGLTAEGLIYTHLVTNDAVTTFTTQTSIAGRGSYQFDLYHRPTVRFGLGQSILLSPQAFEYGGEVYARKIFRKVSLEVNFRFDGGSWQTNKSTVDFQNYMIGTKLSIPLN